MKKHVTWILAIVVIALVGLSAWYLQSGNMGYSNYGSSTTTPPTTSSTSSTTQTTASTSSTASTTTPTTKSFTIRESSFKFDVTQITVNKGDTVKITMINDGGTHNVAFPDFNTRTTINGGGSQTITFVADKTGTFQYYCEVGGHKGLGMVGTLTVQ